MTDESSFDWKSISILLCTPVRGGFSPSYKRSARALEAWCHSQDIPFDTCDVAEAPVDKARDLLAAAYLAATHGGQPYSHCLMIDSGVGFGIETVRRLVAAGEDFTAAAVPLRQSNITKTADLGEARWAATFAVQFPRETRETGKVRLVNKGGSMFASIDMIGAAMLCLRRDVLLRIYDAYPELAHKDGFRYFVPGLFDEDGMSHVGRLKRALDRAKSTPDSDIRDQLITDALAFDPKDFADCGEDVSFCKRWLGVPHDDEDHSRPEIWMLTDAPLMHEGHGFFAGNFSDTFD